MWMLRALWLVVVHDLSEYRHMDDVTGNLFSLFCSTWHAVLNWCNQGKLNLRKALLKKKIKERNFLDIIWNEIIDRILRNIL